jgi:zinc protease
MKSTKMILILIISVLFLNLQAFSQMLGGYDLQQMIPMNPKVKVGKLDNGLTYFILQNKKPENRAELQIIINTGAVQEDANQAGLAHFTEHMCFNGTKNFPKNDLINFLESTGVRFGADVNASTGFDRTYYTLTIPLDSAGLLEKGVQVLNDWLDGVSFDSTEIEKERGVIMEEWRLRGGAQTRTFLKHLPYIGWGSKFKDRFPIGDTSVIRHAPRERFLAYYNDWYRPEISAVIAVGDFDVTQIEALIKNKFHDVSKPGKMPPMPDMSVPYDHEPLVSIALDKEVQMPNFAIYIKHAGDKRGTYGEFKDNLIKTIFGQAINLRLQDLTRKADAPFLYAMANYSGLFFGSDNVYMLVSVPKTDNIMGGYEAALVEAFRMQKHGITKGEFERAKKEMISSMEQTYNERDKTESMPLAQELYRHFYQGESVPGIEKEFELYKTFLSLISVEDFNNFIKGFIKERGMVITYTAADKPEVKAPTADEMLNLFRDVAKRDIPAYIDIATEKPLISKMPTPGTIKSTKEYKELGTTELVLSNGAKVYLKPTEFKNDEVLLTSYALGGTSLAKDADFYSANASAGIVNESGLGEFNVSTLQKMLAGKIANISPYISDISQGFNGNASPKDIETMFQLLYLYFDNPRKDDEAFQAYKTSLKDQIENSGSSPERVFRDTIGAVLGSYNLREMPWTEETVNKIDLDKSLEFYKERFSNPADFTFTLVGNFKVDEIENLIKQYIASIPSKGNKSKWVDVGIKVPTNALKTVVKKGVEPKSSVVLVMNGPFEFNRGNRFMMSALSEVLNIRLREVIREDKGGVYGIYSQPRPELYPKQFYSLYIGFGCAPDRVEELITAAKSVIEDLKAGKFDDPNNASKNDKATLDKVKEILKREHETQIKENNYWLNVINQYSYNGEPITQILEFDKQLAKVDNKSIQTAAKKYLNSDSFKQFILYPED